MKHSLHLFKASTFAIIDNCLSKKTLQKDTLSELFVVAEKAAPFGYELKNISSILDMEENLLIDLVALDVFKKLLSTNTHTQLSPIELSFLIENAYNIKKMINSQNINQLNKSSSIINSTAALLSFPKSLLFGEFITDKSKATLVNLALNLNNDLDSGELLSMLASVRHYYNLCPLAVRSLATKAATNQTLKLNTESTINLLLELPIGANIYNISSSTPTPFIDKLISQHHKPLWELADSHTKFITLLSVLFGNNITARHIADFRGNHFKQGNIKLNNIALIDYANCQYADTPLPFGFKNTSILKTYNRVSESFVIESIIDAKIEAATNENSIRLNLNSQYSDSRPHEELIVAILTKALRYGHINTIELLNDFMRDNNFNWDSFPNILNAPIPEKKTASRTGIALCGALSKYLSKYNDGKGLSIRPNLPTLRLIFKNLTFSRFNYCNHHQLKSPPIKNFKDRALSESIERIKTHQPTPITGDIGLCDFNMYDNDNNNKQMPSLSYVYALVHLLDYSSFDVIITEIPYIQHLLTPDFNSDVINAIIFSSLVLSLELDLRNINHKDSELLIMPFLLLLLTKSDPLNSITQETLNNHAYAKPSLTNILLNSVVTATEMIKLNGNTTTNKHIIKKLRTSNNNKNSLSPKKTNSRLNVLDLIIATNYDFIEDTLYNSVKDGDCFTLDKTLTSISIENKYEAVIDTKQDNYLAKIKPRQKTLITNRNNLLFALKRLIHSPFLDSQQNNSEKNVYKNTIFDAFFVKLLKDGLTDTLHINELNTHSTPIIESMEKEEHLKLFSQEYKLFTTCNAISYYPINENSLNLISKHLYKLGLSSLKFKHFHYNDKSAYITTTPRTWLVLFQELLSAIFNGVDIKNMCFLFVDDNSIKSFNIPLPNDKEDLKWLKKAHLIFT